MDVQMEDASPVRAQERNSNIDTPNQSQNTTPALPPISSLPSLPPLPPAPSTQGTQGASSQPLPPFPSATSASAPSVSTPAATAPAAQPDPAKLEALRRTTLNSYKNRFLNLRDKFDRVNATNTEYTNTLANAKRKEEAIQEEINVLLDCLAQNGASDPKLAKCLNKQPSLSSVLNGS